MGGACGSQQENGNVNKAGDVEADWSLGRENIQAQLEGCKRNQKVFKTIARELQSEGYDGSYQQYRKKVKKLKQEYKKIKDKLNKTGESGRKHLKSWDFFRSAG